jgi:hypothetical protein
MKRKELADAVRAFAATIRSDADAQQFVLRTADIIERWRESSAPPRRRRPPTENERLMAEFERTHAGPWSHDMEKYGDFETWKRERADPSIVRRRNYDSRMHELFRKSDAYESILRKHGEDNVLLGRAYDEWLRTHIRT